MINVLIVDDDRFARMGLISMIPWEKYGMKIVGEAANGKRALEFIQQNPVDLMFVDIAMPVMDGIELIRRVKEESRHIHFVLLTFHEEFEYVQEALRLGALDYISKDKMEMEDYNDIMQRIRKGIAEDNACFETEAENEQLAALEQALGGVLWLYPYAFAGKAPRRSYGAHWRRHAGAVRSCAASGKRAGGAFVSAQLP